MAKIKVDIDISEHLDEVYDKDLIKEMADVALMSLMAISALATRTKRISVNGCPQNIPFAETSTAINSAPTWRTSPDVAVTSATKNY